MTYDHNMQRGVMKKNLPGPRIAEFPSMMTYTEFILSLQEMFLSEQEVGHLALANSSGIPFDIDSEDWTLQEFVKAHGPLSKLKIYLLHFPVSMHVNRAELPVILYYYLVVSFIRMTLNLMMRKLIVL